MKQEDNTRKKKIIIISAIVLLIVAVLLILYFHSRITATTMRVLRLEGEVTLEEGGKNKTVKENLRLNSGNALSTALKSLVSIGLDDTKIVTLDERSRAVFEQSGRQLELKLTDGSLFFEVSQPLTDEESFDIKTSTMVVGIRGTSGWVSVDGEHESLIITDGVVHVIGTNPVTGEVKEIDVKAGQRINVYLYNDRTIDSIMFELVEVTERDLPEFLLERLRENPALLDKVCRETGWDKPWILGIEEDEIPKVVMNEDNDDNGDSDNSDIDNAELLLPDADEEAETAPSDSDRDTILTQQELDWAHSHVAIVDPNTGIFALKDMTLFDPAFYALTNPDVVAKYGTDPDALLWHYLQRGKKEGRPPIAPPTPTPTPTPTWVNESPSYDPYGDEDDDDDDDDDNSSTVASGSVINYPPAGSFTVPTSGVDGPTTMTNGAQVMLRNYSFSNPSMNRVYVSDPSQNIVVPDTLTEDGGTDHMTLDIDNIDFAQSADGTTVTISDPGYNRDGYSIQKNSSNSFTVYDNYGNIVAQESDIATAKSHIP